MDAELRCRQILMGISVFLMLMQNSFAQHWILNNPYPASDANKKIYYTTFTEQPKTLDIAKAYVSNEFLFLTQIYEPLLQYDYFARPYRLVPLTATTMPAVRFYNRRGELIADPLNEEVATSVYTLQLQRGILYQPHPALARDPQGNYIYYPLTPALLKQQHITQYRDFNQLGTRELKADDYIYQIKRLANPHLNSPIYGLMSQYIVGFREFAQQLPQQKNGYLDLRKYTLQGLRKIDDYTFEIAIKGQFTQFQFWLSMPFFAPIPWEVDRFYSQAGMMLKNINFNWYPIGTGPFMLTENNPNRQMILDKNPNYRVVYFPTSSDPKDRKMGYLRHIGERLPLIERAVFILEKESIPRWSKFLEGYYDISGITADSFDKAIQLSAKGNATLSDSLRQRGMRLTIEPELAIYYLGFNMLDPVVGGASERARKLRRAISIAIDYEEYISIFFNRRGIAAQGPLPPGLFGYKTGQAGINPYVYRWNGKAPQRRSIAEAKALMRAAGYPNGRDPKTGQALILKYDVTTTGGPDDKAEMDWMRKQFAKIGIELDVQATQYNRFQEKVRTGNTQIFKWGWSADYPDPENFLFVLCGANGKVKHGGENQVNYDNPRYDALFNLMKNRANDAERQRLIDEMVNLLRYDAPWIFGMHSQLFTLSQRWVAPLKASAISPGTYKYLAIDVPKRQQWRHVWNQPILWPLWLLFGILLLCILPYCWAYHRKQQEQARRAKTKIT